MSTVLLVGQDEMLQFTRAALLRTLDVEIVCSRGEAAFNVLRQRQFDLVVLCHSLPTELATLLMKRIHADSPGTPVLRITMRVWEETEKPVDGDVVSSASPERLIQQAKCLLNMGHGVHSAAAPYSGKKRFA